MNTLIRDHETLYSTYSATGQLDHHPAQVYATTSASWLHTSTPLPTSWSRP